MATIKTKKKKNNKLFVQRPLHHWQLQHYKIFEFPFKLHPVSHKIASIKKHAMLNTKCMFSVLHLVACHVKHFEVWRGFLVWFIVRVYFSLLRGINYPHNLFSKHEQFLILFGKNCI